MQILDEDNHIIVCFKEAGILSQADNTGDLDMLTSLKSYIKEKYRKPGDVFLGLVHRLDRNTEGIMVYARTSKAASRLSESIKQGSFNKSYLAVLEGKFEHITKNGTLKDKLLKDETKKKSYVSPNGKEAILNYVVLDQIEVEGNIYTLVKVDLITGRFHQIRAQFASRGYPLYGDIKYSAKNMLKNYYALSSYHLEFMHPTLKELKVYNYFIPKNIFKKFYDSKDFLEHYHLI